MWNARQIAIVRLASVRQAGLDFCAGDMLASWIGPHIVPSRRRGRAFNTDSARLDR